MKALLQCLLVLILLAAPARAETWIAPEEVTSLDNAILIDARGAKDYAAGHIPGAINVPWQSVADMNGRPGDPGWGVLLPPERLGPALGALGISHDSHVVVYSASPGGWGEDGRIAWSLRVAGLRNVKILDGGIEAWQATGGELSDEVVRLEPVEFDISGYDPTLSASKEEVAASLKSARIVDSRTPEEYAGAQKLGEARGGHLPGAVNIPWTSVFDGKGRLLDKGALAAKMKEAGISPDDEIIAYCTAGIRSAHLVLALREAGFARARNYDASFHEWAGDPQLPLE
jgi:thiosulfate/3-mercaptopyruvate sulfurtransferase